MSGYRCHWEHPHPAHDWQPAVPDPEHPRVLWLGLATVRCPGVDCACDPEDAALAEVCWFDEEAGRLRAVCALCGSTRVPPPADTPPG